MATLARPKGPDYKFKSKNKWFPEAASQTFVKGDWVYLASGKLTICAAAGNDVGAISILGRAAADATGVTDTMLPVEVADDNSEWLFPVYHSTPASAVRAVTDVGATWPLRNHTGNIWCLNKENNGTNDAFVVKSLDYATYPDLTEQYATVWANVLAATRQVL